VKPPDWRHDAQLEDEAAVKAWRHWWEAAAGRPRAEWKKI
jgi:hypothetical protein